MLQSGVTRHGAVRIKACDLLCSCVREEEEVDCTDDEHGYHDEADVRAEGRLFLAGDSTSVHVTHEIESEINHFRHFFSQTSFRPRRCALQGQRHHRCRLSARPATKKAANELAESKSVNAGVSPAKFSNAADTAAFAEDRN